MAYIVSTPNGYVGHGTGRASREDALVFPTLTGAVIAAGFFDKAKIVEVD